jgi:hypothetical protein
LIRSGADHGSETIHVLALHRGTQIDNESKTYFEVHAGSYDSNQGYIYSGQVVHLTTGAVLTERLKPFEMPILLCCSCVIVVLSVRRYPPQLRPTKTMAVNENSFSN